MFLCVQNWNCWGLFCWNIDYFEYANYEKHPIICIFKYLEFSGNLSVLGLVAIFLISTLGVLIKVCLERSACQTFLQALFSPITCKCLLRRLRNCCGCCPLTAFSLRVLVLLLVFSFSQGLVFFCKRRVTLVSQPPFHRRPPPGQPPFSPAPTTCPVDCGQSDGLIDRNMAKYR